jgi:phosphatidylinositol alpha-1,6-mannosyltransferase
MKLRALFITRNYPPKLGGLEKYSYNLIREFEAHDPIFKIVLSKPIIHLVWFLPYAAFMALYYVRRHALKSVHLCDALLAPVGLLLKAITGASVTVTVHGLDITYPNSFYQAIVPRCTARLDRVVCVSRATRDECVARGIPPNLCSVIPNGIRPGEFCLPQPADVLRTRLNKIAGVRLDNKTVLVTVGRLVHRKGIEWFVGEVMPRLGAEYHYLIVGDGSERLRIKATINRHHLENCVSLLGRVTDLTRNLIFNAADVYIMPNITVPGDVEGFGIAIIEAGSCGLPVIGSNLQGIKDAVIHGKTGYLVTEGDADAFLEKIRSTKLNKETVRSVVNATFDWKKIHKRYHSVLIQAQQDKKENHP